MATVTSKSKSTLEMSVTLTLSEIEAEALIEMTKYGFDPFIKGYEKFLGKHYIAPHKKGLELFFTSINSQLPEHVERFKKVKKIFNDNGF